MYQQLKNLIKAHRILQELDTLLTYVGGAVLPLYIDDPAAESHRPTDDVDSIVQATTYGEYVEIEEQLREIGLEQSKEKEDPVCRWKYEGLKIDVMPIRADEFGFSSRWYEQGVEYARNEELSQEVIRIFTAPYFLADKIDTFRDRGEEDFFGSPDFEDIIRLVDGCTELDRKVQQSKQDVKTYIAKWIDQFLKKKGTMISSRPISGSVAGWT